MRARGLVMPAGLPRRDVGDTCVTTLDDVRRLPSGAPPAPPAGRPRAMLRRPAIAKRHISLRLLVEADMTIEEEAMIIDETRTRTITWSDPLITAKESAHRSGMDALSAIREGRVPQPPLAEILGVDLVEVAHGRVSVTLEPAEYHYNAIGTVHGGVYAILLDTATGAAVQSCLPEGVGYTTLDLTAKYVRAIAPDLGPVTCVGTVLTVGRTIAVAEARLVTAANELAATALSTCRLFR